MRILVIVPPERRDFYSYLENDKKNDYVLLWYESKKKYKESGIIIPPFFKDIFFWDIFFTPQKLLRKISPDKIVFFQIIDQRQIALIVAAKKKKVSTFYLEHGAAGDRETAIERAEFPGFLKKQKAPYIFRRLKSSFFQVVKTKLFYYSNFSGFRKLRHLFLYWKLPFVMLRYTPNKALRKCIFPERVPKHSIVFNKVNLSEYQSFTDILEKDAILTGLPFFDKYFQTTIVNKDHIVYIEHPCLEQNLLDWTIEHHRFVAESLERFANSRKRKVFVKLHPTSNMKLWEHVIKENSYLEVVQAGDFTETYLSSSLILGYSSSLITGLLCARKNIVNVGWHPKPQIFGSDFSKTGLCHLSMSITDLENKVEVWEQNNLCITNEKLYTEYLMEYNYPFDGQATQRVLEAIHNL